MDNALIRVLLVDDDEDDFVITRDLLAEIDGCKFDLEWVSTFEIALTKIDANAHDVYLVDYRLGEHTGLELLHRATSNGCQKPIILLTGQGDRQVDVEAMKSGAADYLIKGQIDAPLLDRSIRYAIERKRAQVELDAYREHLEALVQERTAKLEEAMVEIAAARDRIDAILHSVADGLIVTDMKHKVILANPAAETLLGCQLEDMIGREIDVQSKNNRLREIVQNTIKQKTTGYEVDIELDGSGDGRTRVVRARTALVDDRHGQPLGTVTIIQDVTRLREVDRLKTELLTTAAHELRTPLTSTLGFSELLLTRELNRTRQERYLRMIYSQSVHLTEIIDDLLDISRLEAGRGLDLKLEPVDISKLIREVAMPYIEGETGHKIIIAKMEKLPPIQGDPFRLTQVGRNLLSNAIKYSPNGGTIIIRGRLIPGYLEISLQDDGIGMTPEQQIYLFEPFYRADTSNTAVGGAGLGLAISKMIVEQHNGKIWLESKEGDGTTAYFTLPLTGTNNMPDRTPAMTIAS